MTLILIVILVALVFEFINGFHDTANSIATVVGTKVLTPRQAIVLGPTVADAHYAGNGAPSLNGNTTTAISQYDVACFQVSH